jgi:tRNA pseudouridine32 synthase/23S rRNA pseudouridine746 synthase
VAVVGNSDQSKISYFSEEVLNGISLPERFTFPFYYEPHRLTKMAAAELQHYLETQITDHNFGLSSDTDEFPIGKMFGVLVVEDSAGKIGYLSAFSGKLAGTNDHPKFVPPVFDMLTEGSFFPKEKDAIDAINKEVLELSSHEDYVQLKQDLDQLSAQSIQEVSAFKEHLKNNKDLRKRLRQEQKNSLTAEDYALFEADMVKQSLHDKRQLRDLTEKWDGILEDVRIKLAPLDAHIETLANERKERSAALQARLFNEYTFLNKAGRRKSLHDIFSTTVFGKPPSAAGECATPKLLQFAFANGYKPLAMAEFWWGAAPKSEIRKHKQFYPACTGKCKPILEHMLEGIPIDDNPFLQPTEDSVKLEIVYEDDYFLIINKPSGLRSVPGVNIHDSVYSRLKTKLNIEPFIVHRLDMDTSGLLVVAKRPEIHKHLQTQFLKRTVSKRYTALLSKVIDSGEGEIKLPLRPDLYNRPMQLVCFKTGKTAITRWKTIETVNATTRIHFWPLTGRTHQLRMHSAHELGLNAPILGDDLYGTSDKRLYLHAAYLAFVHPKTKERMSFEVAEDF